MAKLSVTYNRKVTTPIQYESLTIGASMDFDSDGRSFDDIYEYLQKWVDDKITQRLYQMEETLDKEIQNGRIQR